METNKKKKYVTWYKDGATSFGELVDIELDGTLRVKNPAFLYFAFEGGKATVNFTPWVLSLFYKNTNNVWSVKADAVLEKCDMLDMAIINYENAVNIKAKKSQDVEG